MRSNEQLVWRHNHSDGSYSAVGHAIYFLTVNPGRTLLCYYDLIIMADLSQQAIEFKNRIRSAIMSEELRRADFNDCLLNEYRNYRSVFSDNDPQFNSTAFIGMEPR